MSTRRGKGRKSKREIGFSVCFSLFASRYSLLFASVLFSSLYFLLSLVINIFMFDLIFFLHKVDSHVRESYNSRMFNNFICPTFFSLFSVRFFFLFHGYFLAVSRLSRTACAALRPPSVRSELALFHRTSPFVRGACRSPAVSTLRVPACASVTRARWRRRGDDGASVPGRVFTRSR